jgi:BirA family biotin operon repressor/biotin-[acetyl-CoA-carboxylase] ligase
MDQRRLEKYLRNLPLGPVRYFDQVASTNDLAAGWARNGAPNGALVVADEQTAGRGRGERRWYTPPGSALAFSLVLRDIEPSSPTAYSGLGALAVCVALEQTLSSHPPIEIKWPNDILAGDRKLAGVLPEIQWLGERLQAVVLGIGINVAPQSVPPAVAVSIPATCVQALTEDPIDRWELLKAVLVGLLHWRGRVGEPELFREWESRLAYRGQWVQIDSADRPPVEGRIMGLDAEGGLTLRLHSGATSTLRMGEIRLRPVDSSEK